MNRKQFVQFASFGAASVITGGMTGSANQSVTNTITQPVERAKKAVYVPSGKNRFEEEMMIWGAIPLQIKVSSNDSDGAFFLFEHANMRKGGPPRHFHYEQDEWFYAVDGEFAFEVGDEKFTLKPGDSLFAPRRIPHVWAYTGNKPGTLLLAVQSAGSLEQFFMEGVRMNRPPSPEEAEKQFAAHGMKVVGPPLAVS